MTNDNYIRHFKVLGKLAKLYDIAAADESDLETLLSTFVDQYATGTVASLPAILIFPNHTVAWSQAISAGATALQTVAKNAASAYLIDDDFTGDLTTTPAATTAAAVLTALATEMGAGVDNKTLTTKSSTGLVNFFDAILGSSGSWNTSGTPTYADGTYVVSTVV